MCRRTARHAATDQSTRHDAAAKSGYPCRPTCDFTKTYTDKQKARARKVLREFESWRERNKQAWAFLEYLALQLAEAQRRIGSARLLEAVRSRDFTSVDGTPTKVNNNHAPIVSRVLVREHPELSSLVEQRTSVYDVLFADGE